ncbi:hypothetical protein QBC38DRAFT_52307 [Podospora fimiseda]|uniref:BHLH domain-containing protein n=1 Tax=Podospora fimiseda TaxID=252190 RepID=A0AAN7GUI1_9PEZI|nr:hypothetical protein QBC38DRAFT_52307 [Podospora fimiseda]
MDWNPDTVPENQGFVDCRQSGPTAVMSAVDGDATMASSINLGLVFEPYCLQTQAQFPLITPSSCPGISGASYLPPTPLESDCPTYDYWFPPTATTAAQDNIFPFQQELHAPHVPFPPTHNLPSSVATPPSQTFTAVGTPTGSHADTSPPTWTTPSPSPSSLPPPQSNKTSPALTNTTMAQTGPKKQPKATPTKPPKTSPAQNNTNKKSSDTPGRAKGQLNPSNFGTWEEYQTELRLWHNKIGKKYRNKLNSQFEMLHAVLNPEEEDNNHVVVAGRTINKARTLDMARQRILDLRTENNTIRAELEQMARLLQAQGKG